MGANIGQESMERVGTKIGEHYAKQGTSWDEVSKKPSSGYGSNWATPFVKTGYDTYMANKVPTAEVSSVIGGSPQVGASIGLAQATGGSNNNTIGMVNTGTGGRQELLNYGVGNGLAATAAGSGIGANLK